MLELISTMDYLAQHNLPVAQRIEARIIETTERLARRPIGRPGKQPDIYEKLVTAAPYLIVYRFSDEPDGQIQVIRLFHSAQN